jgi:hypothetical protein
VHSLREDVEEPVHDPVPLLRIELPGELHRDPFMSANSTVTCLRSPSSADLDRKISSARCFGVYARGSRSGVSADSSRLFPQPLQNFWPAGLE